MLLDYSLALSTTVLQSLLMAECVEEVVLLYTAVSVAY